MVYIHAWQDYQEAAEALYAHSPNNTRYCIKWKSGEGKLVLKITDDVSCLKFKTHSSIFLNRFEALNLSLMTKMQNQQPAHIDVDMLDAKTATTAPPKAVAEATVSTPAEPAKVSAGPTAGGVKKKPKKKKK